MKVIEGMEKLLLCGFLSYYKLYIVDEKDINVPVSRVQDILHDRRKISVDTSLRLGKYFGVSEKYFLDMQNDIDLRNEKSRIAAELEAIPLAVKSGQ